MTEMDRYTIAVLQQAVKRKARKVGRPIALDGERILYCMRCLKSNHEVEWMAYEPFFIICDECVRNLAIFMEHSREEQRHTQAQSEPDESESAPDRLGAQDEGC